MTLDFLTQYLEHIRKRMDEYWGYDEDLYIWFRAQMVFIKDLIVKKKKDETNTLEAEDET